MDLFKSGLVLQAFAGGIMRWPSLGSRTTIFASTIFTATPDEPLRRKYLPACAPANSGPAPRAHRARSGNPMRSAPCADRAATAAITT